ncbi:MAG: hypothetical protein IPM42_10455 [Saprospiraceae bacterium]|nr:hypothetical protein [Saprospiraceae bacterium]
MKTKYYYDVIRLRIWAYLYYILDKCFPGRKRKLNSEYLNFSKFENSKFEFDIRTNPLYYTYKAFRNPVEIFNNLANNDKGIVTNHLNYNPEKPNFLYTSHYGMICYNYFLNTSDETYLKIIKEHAIFIKSSIEPNGGLPHQEDFLLFHQKSPWYSGITQGLVVSFLTRCEMLFPSEGFIETAKLALDFMLDKKNGLNITFTDSFRNELKWIEEYPMTPPSRVLNGFITSIIGMIDFSSLTKDQNIQNESTEFVKSLIKSLHLFIYPVGIKHNLKQLKFGNIDYQGLHTYQFLHLYQLTKIELLKKIALDSNQNTDWKLFAFFKNISSSENLNIRENDFINAVTKNE